MAVGAVRGKPKRPARVTAKEAAKTAFPGVNAKVKEPGSPILGRRCETGGAEEIPALPAKALRPSQCRGFMRKRIAEEFPKIVHGFLKKAKTGNCAHVKLASDLLEKPPAKAASRKKGSAERMLEELRAL